MIMIKTDKTFFFYRWKDRGNDSWGGWKPVDEEQTTVEDLRSYIKNGNPYQIAECVVLNVEGHGSELVDPLI